jgi:murein DD-endopeptidase MepM/ murein hydrolase activator NlpD
VSRHGRTPSRRTYWLLGALGAVLVAVLGVVVAIERAGTAADPKGAGFDGPSTVTLPTTVAATPSPTPTPTPTPVPTTSAPTSRPAAAKYVFPVVSGKASYAHTHHDYPATDIISPCGSPVLAVTDGVILAVTRVDTWTAKANLGATRGGLSVSLLGDDGVRYYGSHLRSINAGVEAGVRVKAGQNIAVVGDTGDASACHLHFGISPPCARTGDWWLQRGVIWPWPYLDAWRAGTSKSAVTEIRAWSQQHGCPTAPTVDP